ncbi:MAG TPA: class I SAM-dependent methyltransferase [Polyangiales bacterium]|nr:class I SAM-dependent methyltransferase [Polyangiales bacterium]
MLRNITSRYSALESWAYDRFIVPAADKMIGEIEAVVNRSIPANAAVLEVGCGGGQLARRLVERRSDLTWTGLDLSREQVARARRRTADMQRLSFVEGDAQALPFSDALFDVVVSIASIKHWPDQALGLRECIRVLRPDGLLLVVEADRGCRYQDAARFVDSSPLPPMLRPVGLALFRTWIAGRSLDREEAQQLLEGLSVAERGVKRLPDMPVLEMTARK